MEQLEQYLGPLILLGITLFITLILYATSGSSLKEMNPHLGLRTFLVFLRLVIGWHFAVEGWEKVYNNPGWTSAFYLQGSTGPLGKHFREIGTEDLFAKLTLTEDGKLSPQLDSEYQRYRDAFVDHYTHTDEEEKNNLTDAQIKKIDLVMAQAKEGTVKWIKDSDWVKVYSPYMNPDNNVRKMNVADRIAYYNRVATDLERVEEKDIPMSGEGAEKKTTRLYAEATQILGLLQTELKKQMYAGPSSFSGKLYKELTSDQQRGNPPPPETAPLPPFSEMSQLQWADFIIPWALLIVGLSLLGGIFTRPMCVVGAVLLVMFFVAMPPIPGWPENPKAEGHYLYVNKNIIEMIALLALATTASGRWFGLDALLQFLNPFSRNRSGPQESAPQPKPATQSVFGSPGSQPQEVLSTSKEN